MISTASPQRAVVPLHTEQLATSPVCNQKQQPVIENAVPVQLCHLLKQSYGLEEGADPYIIPSCPNILFVLYRGQLRAINSSTRQIIQQNGVPSQPSNDDSKGSSKSPLEDVKGDGQVAPPATPVTPLRPPSTIGRQSCESEWHKAVSDQERELWKRECRRNSAYKTSLCNPFRNSGKCSYGLGCRFAHGISELRPAPRPHPKYKTQLCNKFALYGSCPYGSRCQFIHMRPCEMQNDLGYMNFAASLDSGGRHALKCRHYSMCGRPRFYGKNACVVEVPGSGHCNSFPQQFFGSPNNLQKTPTILMPCNHFDSENFFPPGVMGSVEGTSGVLPVIGSNGLYSDVAAVDDLFSAMSIAEGGPFTQSCFPRINVENCASTTGATLRRVSGADMPAYRTS